VSDETAEDLSFDPESFEERMLEEIPLLVRKLFAETGGNAQRIKRVKYRVDVTYYEEEDYTDRVL
jgi:hypothetical protein